jgi:hypothetical protein
MMIGAIVVITGSVVQATCHNLAGFMIGRFIRMRLRWLILPFEDS